MNGFSQLDLLTLGRSSFVKRLLGNDQGSSSSSAAMTYSGSLRTGMTAQPVADGEDPNPEYRDNLVVNSSFEFFDRDATVPQSWAATGAAALVVGAAGADGRAVMAFGPGGSLSQTLPLSSYAAGAVAFSVFARATQPGAKLALSVLATASQPAPLYRLDALGNLEQTDLIPADGAFYRFYLTALVGSGQLACAVSSAAGSFEVDCCKLEHQPGAAGYILPTIYESGDYGSAVHIRNLSADNIRTGQLTVGGSLNPRLVVQDNAGQALVSIGQSSAGIVVTGAGGVKVTGRGTITAGSGGNRAELSASGLRAYGSGVEQVSISAADGKLRAGGGDVVLDADGLSIDTVNDAEGVAAIKFYGAGGALDASIRSVPGPGPTTTIAVNPEGSAARSSYRVTVGGNGVGKEASFVLVNGQQDPNTGSVLPWAALGASGQAFRGFIVGSNARRPDATLDVEGTLAVSGFVRTSAGAALGGANTTLPETGRLAVAAGGVANTAGAQVVMSEWQFNNGNTGRSQMVGVRRAATGTWQATASRWQYAVDSSFVDGSLAYVEVGANSVGAGYVRLGANGADKVFVTAAGLGVGVVPSTHTLQLATNSAGKPGSNVWDITSDQRCKRDVAPYERGLELVERINPVSYSYNGLAGTPSDDQRYVGVLAQQVLEVAPSMVKTVETADLPDLLQYDGNELQYAMLNSIKELSAQVRELRAELAELKAAKG